MESEQFQIPIGKNSRNRDKIDTPNTYVRT